MAVDDVYKLELHQLYEGQKCLNVVHIRLKSAAVDAQSVATTVAQQFRVRLTGMQVDDVTYPLTVARQVRGGTVVWDPTTGEMSGGAVYEDTPTSSNAGQNPAIDGLPGTVAALISLKTGFAGRTKRGRMYVVGIGEDRQNQGRITTASITAFQALITQLIGLYGASGSSADFEWGIWSQRTASGNVPATPPATGFVHVDPVNPAGAYQAIALGLLDPILASQRRRRIGVGT